MQRDLRNAVADFSARGMSDSTAKLQGCVDVVNRVTQSLIAELLHDLVPAKGGGPADYLESQLTAAIDRLHGDGLAAVHEAQLRCALLNAAMIEAILSADTFPNSRAAALARLWLASTQSPTAVTINNSGTIGNIQTGSHATATATINPTQALAALSELESVAPASFAPMFAEARADLASGRPTGAPIRALLQDASALATIAPYAKAAWSSLWSSAA